MKKQLLYLGYALSIITIVSCSGNRLTTNTTSNAKETSQSLIPTPDENGVISGTWKGCQSGDEQ